MADLFQRDKSVISRHIGNVFGDGELKREATVAKSATVQTEGGKQVTREIEFFNLDVIISVGYRVKSRRGTQFRIWATQRLRESIVKGFTMDDEQLERIRDIRASWSNWRASPRNQTSSKQPSAIIPKAPAMRSESAQKETPGPLNRKRSRKGSRGQRAQYAATVPPRQTHISPIKEEKSP
jgi:hypothetical protein